MLATELDQFLDDVALLVDLDREHRPVAALVAALVDRLLERARQRRDAQLQDVRDAQQDRQLEAAAAQVFDQLGQRELGAALAHRLHDQVALVVDRERFAAPGGQLVELGAVAGRPGAEFLVRTAQLWLAPLCACSDRETSRHQPAERTD